MLWMGQVHHIMIARDLCFLFSTDVCFGAQQMLLCYKRYFQGNHPALQGKYVKTGKTSKIFKTIKNVQNSSKHKQHVLHHFCSFN